jgi:hypothetical protein
MDAEPIRQDEDEVVRVDISIQPADLDEPLSNADSIEWRLTTDPDAGRGETVLTVPDADISVIDEDTFELRLTAQQTDGLKIGTRYAEAEITFSGDADVAALEPPIEVVP